MPMTTTRIGIGTALSLHSTRGARLQELIILRIKALLSWHISELCSGNDACFRLLNFPEVVAPIVAIFARWSRHLDVARARSASESTVASIPRKARGGLDSLLTHSHPHSPS